MTDVLYNEGQRPLDGRHLDVIRDLVGCEGPAIAELTQIEKT